MTMRRRSAWIRSAPGFAAFALSGCAIFAPPPPPPPPPPATISIARLYDQPAERAFINGLRYYEEGQYERAELLLKRALADGLKDRNDVAVAQKHLAFIACAYSRPSDCEQAFRAAFIADPTFRLTDAEVGHPLWGPVYKQVAAEHSSKAAPATK
ncbi:MAG TPA: TssQ family T6SS-associated lipoprotein [Burkholderiaceae bacterium]|nr:TssQ family T6SS-associated lipoprotein [Burkholderiaceae bacterium]